jgi:putative protein-disulfide isomerase
MNRLFFFILINIAIATSMKAQEKIIYVGDPMCSWCYGFAPQLEKLVEEHKVDMDIELVTGGLRPYFKKPISEMKEFLSHHWQDVHKASKQPFSYDILDRADINYDTEPSCRAVVVVRHMDSTKEFEFFKLIQEAFYYKNKDLRNVESYDSVLEGLGLDKKEFEKRFNSEEYKELVKADFKRASELGVQGFPTLLFQSGDKITVLSNGYTLAEKVNEVINSAKQ